MKNASRVALIAWLIAAVYYFYQYALRSAPAVMLPELSSAFGITSAGVASLAGLFYYGYAPCSLLAGVALDKFGPRKAIPVGAALVGIGSLMFATGSEALAGIGRVMQGAGGAFALIGAVYIATKSFPPSRAGTLIGATQMFGMAGGSAGQFAVGPLIAMGFAWSSFWLGMGVAGLVIAVLLLVLLPRQDSNSPGAAKGPGVIDALFTVFRNPQSLMCGAIAGLLFIPTTIFDMVWGVRFLQEGVGHDFGEAVMRSATVPFGWMIGCPLLGAISDRTGRRKPIMFAGGLVLLGCLAWILYGPTDVLPPYVLGTVTGIASGAAMLPYTVIKEANPANLAGTATGVVNFLNFMFSALLGPLFARSLVSAAGGAAEMELEHYQVAFEPLLYGVAVALVLILILKETGPAVKKSGPTPERNAS